MPPEFWQTDVMAAALDSGDIGQVLRAYRCHPYHRQQLSQALVAGWLHMSQAAVCRIEKGRRRVTIDEIAQIAGALAIPITLPWAPVHHAREGSDSFSDRSLLGTGVGASHFLDCAPTPAVAHAPRRPEGFDQLVETLIHATPSADAPADLAALSQASASAKRSLQACEYALAVHQLAQLLSMLASFDESLAGDDALRLWAVRAHAHQSAAGVLLKLGHEGLAYIAAARSLEAAQRSQDPLVIGSSARVVAHAFLSTGHVDEARMTATSAAAKLETFERTDERLSVFGSLLLRGAIAAARGGDRQGALELLEEAGSAAKALGNDGNVHWTAFGPTNVALHRVHVAVAFGDAGTALELAKSVDPHRLAVTERRTSLYIDLARALVQWDRYGEACRMLVAAERLAPEELASRASVLALIAGMVHRAPRSAQPAIRTLAVRTGAHQ